MDDLTERQKLAVFSHPTLAGEVAGVARRRGVALSIKLHPSPHLVMERSISVQKLTALHIGKSHSPSRRRERQSGSGNPPDCPKQRGGLFSPIEGWASATAEKGDVPLPDTTPRPVANPSSTPFQCRIFSGLSSAMRQPSTRSTPPSVAPLRAPVASVTHAWRVTVASVSRRRDVAMASPVQFGPIRPKNGRCNGVNFTL
jgi:hypothetical protein